MPKKPPEPNPPSPENESILGLPTEGRSDAWICTVNLLEAYTRGHLIIDYPKTTKDKIWQILDDVDTSHTFRDRIDRKAFDATPGDRMQEFWNLYCAAVITGMIRRATLLEPYESYELVSFPAGFDKDRKALTSESEDYSKQLPALAPLEGEMPSMNTEYLKMLYIRLGYNLGRKGVLPFKKGKGPTSEDRAAILIEKLGFEELYAETMAASSIYFQAHLMKGGTKAAMALAKAGSPFLFMWHILLGHFEMMVDRLLKGTELEFAPKLEPGRKLNDIARPPKTGISRDMVRRDNNT